MRPCFRRGDFMRSSITASLHRIGRKIVLTLLACCLCIGLTGCGSGKDGQSASHEDTGRLKVVTTIFPQYDFVRAIAGDQVELSMLLSPGAETHSYEPTPQDIRQIGECDLFIYIGGENDTWVEKILDSVDNPDMQTLKLMDCVTVLPEEEVEGMEHEHEDEEEHDHEGPDMDEHVWTSPKNAILIMDKICQMLSDMDPEHADAYAENAKSYEAELTALDQDFREVVADGKRTEVVFGDRFPMRYFAEEYHLTWYAAFSGCATDTEASASTIAFLTDKVKEDQIPVVFQMELGSGNIAGSIAETTGAKVLTFQSCHNLTKEQFEAGVTYVDLMRENIEALKEALN